MLVVDLRTNEYSDVDEHEAFVMQLRGTHHVVHTSAEHSYEYARFVLHKPFPLGEAAIAGDASRSYLYALIVLHKPFPLGEAAIARDAKCAYCYARYVLRGRFPQGEAAIATYVSAARLYKKIHKNA